jgi:hypothetical protein
MKIVNRDMSQGERKNKEKQKKDFIKVISEADKKLIDELPPEAKDKLKRLLE